MKVPQVFQCGIAWQLPWVRNLSAFILCFFLTFFFYEAPTFSALHFRRVFMYLLTGRVRPGQRIWYSDWLWAGRSGAWTPMEQDSFSSPYSTRPDLWTHPCSLWREPVLFPGGGGVKSVGASRLTPTTICPEIKNKSGIALLPPLCF